MAGESKLQTKIKNKLRLDGWFVTKISMTSRPGWPDLYLLKDGRSVWLEIKDGKKLKELQIYIRDEIRKFGGESYSAANWDEFIALNLISTCK